MIDLTANINRRRRDEGESTEQAALRELDEEVGLKLNEKKYDEKITKEVVIKYVISAFIDGIECLNEDEMLSVNENTDIIKDFKMDSDDASFMIMDLEKHFSVNASYEEWRQVSSIRETADLILKHL